MTDTQWGTKRLIGRGVITVWRSGAEGFEVDRHDRIINHAWLLLVRRAAMHTIRNTGRLRSDQISGVERGCDYVLR